MVAQNKIQVEPFTKERFVELVRAAGGGVVTRQVEYLARYLDELKVGTIVRESRYVDRHYMDEYALYYSRMLNAPPNTVMRIHFFEKKFAANALRRWMAAAFTGREVATTIDAEAGRYFGFSCIRPIADSPIGRTVLARWPDDNKPRDIWTVGKHSVAHRKPCVRCRWPSIPTARGCGRSVRNGIRLERALESRASRRNASTNAR